MRLRWITATCVAALSCAGWAGGAAKTVNPYTAEELLEYAETVDGQIGLEMNKLARPSDTVGSIGTGLFGESVDLYTGSTEFKVTDIDIPGNGTLPVRLARRLSIEEGDWFPSIGGLGSTSINTDGLRGWQLDVPFMSGTFAVHSTLGGWVVGPTGSANRCSTGEKETHKRPPTIAAGNGIVFLPQEYWHGYQMYVPGVGSQDLLSDLATSVKPSTGGPYYWGTKNFWAISCIPLASGGTGEGFLAKSPDGTEYRFDKMVSRSGLGVLSGLAKHFQRNDINGNPIQGVEKLMRQKVYLLATQVKDRFGHTVNYNYTGIGKLSSITASDGRQITLGYSGDRIVSASDGQNTWTYGYTSGTEAQLQSVTLPDGSAWQYASPPPIGLDTMRKDRVKTCLEPITAYKDPNRDFSWSASHPSGASATFNFRSIYRGRSYVPWECNVDTNATPSDEAFLFYPVDNVHVALRQKILSGAGITGNYTWTYDYSQTLGCFVNSPPVSPGRNCVDGVDPTSVWTDVTAPDNSRVRRTFGNRYNVSEGQLQTEASFEGGWPYNQLQSVATTYVTNTVGQPFPAKVGTSPQVRANTFLTQELRPQLARTTTRQGVNFSATTQAFDLFTNPTQVYEASTAGPGYTRTRNLTWWHVTDANWVLGQLDRSLLNNIEVVDNDYTAAPQVLLSSVKHYGRIHQTYGFYPNGSAGSQAGELNTVTDGRSKTTTLSSYYRGVPQLITHPAGGGTRGAVVDALGRITSLTDEASYTTGYSYDSGGRLSQIRQPPGNGAGAWTVTNISSAKQAGSEFGIAGNRWRQTVTTGNRQKVIDFDVLLRPILSRQYDAANYNNTLQAVVNRYDEDGQLTFGSYPQRSISTVQAVSAGVSTSYDGLGRKTLEQQSSELGALNTTYQYQNAFKTQVTNPRGYSSITEYQAYADPGEANVVKIDSPEGVTTLLTRDAFGKPAVMTRNAVYAGLPITLTRRYVYDEHQRLCKTIEPESGATIVDYDLGSNVAWTAAGQNLLGTTSCDRLSVPASARISQSYDDLSRPLVTSFGDGSPSISRTWTPDGLPSTVASSLSTWTYTYNDRRLLTREALSLAGIVPNGSLATPLEVNYQYNSLGDLSSWDYPGSGSLALSPNALGEPSQTGSYANGISWHPNGMLAGMSYGNGVYRSVALNARQLPQTISESGVSFDTYSYDASGNIAAIADGHTSDGFQTGRSFSYDGRDRLTGAIHDQIYGGMNYNNVAISFQYDGLDNIRQYRTPAGMPFRNMDYEYNASTWRLNRVYDPATNVNFIDYGYDARGNATSRGAWGSQVFDLGNRMRSMAGTGVAATYDYDGDGRRFLIAEPGAPRRIQFYNKTGLLLSEIGINPGNTVTELKSYFYSGRNGIAERTRTSSSDTTTYVHSDHLGSPVARSNSVSSVFERTMFEVYGMKLNSQPNPPYGIGLFPDGLGFAGHRTDRVSGLSYMQQRYYDPVAGRFISMDPVTADSGALFNRYAYANNNPVAQIDDDGRQSRDFNAISRETDFKSPPKSPDDNFGEIMAEAVVTTAQLIPQVRTATALIRLGINSRQTGGGSRDKPIERVKGTPAPNMSPPGSGRRGALNEAKRQNGVPTSQSPSKTSQNRDRNEKVQPGRSYDYEVPDKGGGTKTVTIRDDAGGHDYGPGDPQNRGPHFNDKDKRHYDYPK